DFMEKAARLKRRIISAMIYPAVVITVAAIIVLGIMILIVPKFTEIFEDFDTKLPALTIFLIDFSRWLGGPLLGKNGNPDQLIPGVVYVLLAPFVIYFGLKLIRKSKGGKHVTDWIVLRLPVVGTLTAKATVAK